MNRVAIKQGDRIVIVECDETALSNCKICQMQKNCKAKPMSKERKMVLWVLFLIIIITLIIIKSCN